MLPRKRPREPACYTHLDALPPRHRLLPEARDGLRVLQQLLVLRAQPRTFLQQRVTRRLQLLAWAWA